MTPVLSVKGFQSLRDASLHRETTLSWSQGPYICTNTHRFLFLALVLLKEVSRSIDVDIATSPAASRGAGIHLTIAHDPAPT